MALSTLNIRVIAHAVRRRIRRLFGIERDPYANSPPGLALSPSARHFADYETVRPKMRFSAGEWSNVEDWRKTARAKLVELTGYSRGSAIPEILRDETLPLSKDATRRRVYLRSRPGVEIPVHLVEAKYSMRPKPVMICLQGTNTGAHLSWGEKRFPADADPKAKNYEFALQAIQHGYLAVAIEQSCFGERRETQIRPRSTAPCVDATMHAILLGRSLLGERCSDVSAVIDWLLGPAMAPFIDSRRIHIMGHSSGGSVAMYAAAMDERIGAVLACGCVGFIRDTIGRRRDDQGQNVVPGILQWMETADVVGLVAPRPFVTVAGTSDPIWPSSAAEPVIAEARKIYAQFDSADAITLATAPGGHFFRPELSWDAFSAAQI